MLTHIHTLNGTRLAHVRCDRCGTVGTLRFDRHVAGRAPRGWQRADVSPADGWPEQSMHLCRTCSP